MIKKKASCLCFGGVSSRSRAQKCTTGWENVKSYTSETASQSIPVSNQPKETKTVEGLALTEDLEVGRSEECGGSCV